MKFQLREGFCFIYSVILISSCGENSISPEKNLSHNLYPSLSSKDSADFTDSVFFDSIQNKNDSTSTPFATDILQVQPDEKNDSIDTRNVSPNDVIGFAETLIGTPYVYGSTDPKVGFDCSGFITYVFSKFGIAVPRSSIQFTNVGKTIPLQNAQRGDIILFTDPDVDNTISLRVGHMGLITSNENGILNFIHSSSGKAMGVVITPFNEHYQKRYVRIGRIFRLNEALDK